MYTPDKVNACKACIRAKEESGEPFTETVSYEDGTEEDFVLDEDDIVVVGLKRCENPNCIGAANVYAYFEQFGMMVSKRCYDWLKMQAKNASTWSDFSKKLHIVNSEADCENTYCSEAPEVVSSKSPQLAQLYALGMQMDGPGPPITRRCLELMGSVVNQYSSEQNNGGASEFDRYWQEMSSNFTIVESEDECTYPRCPDRVENVEAPPNRHAHSHATPIDTSRCDCTDAMTRAVHTEILNHITQVEKYYDELHVAHKVEHVLRAQTGTPKNVDMSVPPDGNRLELRMLGRFMQDLKLDGKTEVNMPS
ncbi:hypothetical protein LTR10_000353 [Elasticomyces elasticus]|nr:hypothetical protein LTR10_000353 [Elasticomyces elasticus]KAK4980393.1 hypothetical protein LTR42_000700 [Elasticomyces elasticus]